jgi:hypothetical protein
MAAEVAQSLARVMARSYVQASSNPDAKGTVGASGLALSVTQAKR